MKLSEETLKRAEVWMAEHPHEWILVQEEQPDGSWLCCWMRGDLGSVDLDLFSPVDEEKSVEQADIAGPHVPTNGQRSLRAVGIPWPMASLQLLRSLAATKTNLPPAEVVRLNDASITS